MIDNGAGSSPARLLCVRGDYPGKRFHITIIARRAPRAMVGCCSSAWSVVCSGVLSNVGTVRYLLEHPKGHTLSEYDVNSESSSELIAVSDPMAALAELRSVYNPELDFRKLALE